LSHSASTMRSFLMLFLDSRIKQGPASSLCLFSSIHLFTWSLIQFTFCTDVRAIVIKYKTELGHSSA
jgi:hypothetical protein